MKSPKILLIISSFFILLNLSSAHVSMSKHLQMATAGKQFYFNGQKIDHFNPTDQRTFAQRYWIAEDFYIPGPSSPIILYICGEATCRGTPGPNSFVYQVAQKAGALIVALEHRYYGTSQPLGDQSMKTENLRYLTVEQALEDLSYFMKWFKANYKSGIADTQPWVTAGGSYPGALSAWFRSKYPHLTAGAWASSGVVKAIVDFSDFDYQIYLAVSKSGPKCPQAIQEITAYFERQLFETSTEEQQKFKSRFGQNALKLSHTELLWYIADSFVLQVQYGKRTELCKTVTEGPDFDSIVEATIQLFVKSQGCEPYGSYFVKNSTYDAEWEDVIVRQWNYQVCSQLGWFQTPAKNSAQALRSQRINLTFYKQFCKEAYGKDFWPNVDTFNNAFGGFDFVATNVTNTNGCEDPWQWAARNSSSGSISNIYINCDGCAHCVDFHGSTADDPAGLKAAHAQIEKEILGYLGKLKIDEERIEMTSFLPKFLPVNI